MPWWLSLIISLSGAIIMGVFNTLNNWLREKVEFRRWLREKQSSIVDKFADIYARLKFYMIDAPFDTELRCREIESLTYEADLQIPLIQIYFPRYVYKYVNDAVNDLKSLFSKNQLFTMLKNREIEKITKVLETWEKLTNLLRKSLAIR